VSLQINVLAISALSSNRQHTDIDDCLELKRKDY